MLTTIEGIYENGAVRLLEPLPGVIRARVVVTVLPEPAAATPTLPGTSHPQHFRAATELGQRLVTIRRHAIANGLNLLNQDEVLEEIRHRRGEDE